MGKRTGISTTLGERHEGFQSTTLVAEFGRILLHIPGGGMRDNSAMISSTT
jgi:hypothetical protein